MATLPELRPSSFVSGTLVATTTVANIADESDATFIESNSGASLDGQWVYELGNTPADFGSMDSEFTITLRALLSATGDDLWQIRGELVDSAGAALTTVPAYQTISTTSAVELTFSPTFTGTNDKTTWDGARILLDYRNVKTKGADGNVIRVTRAGLSGTYTVAATAPGAPTGLGATPGDTEVALSWTAPASDGGSAITDYLIEYNPGGAGWSTFSDGVSTGTTSTVTGLTNGVSHDFRVSAINAIGTGTPSATATATPVAAAVSTAVEIFDGTSWVPATVEIFDGTSSVAGSVELFDGASFV